MSTVALFEGSNRAFGPVDRVIMGGNELDVHVVAPDVGFGCLGEFVVHDIECGCISRVLRVARMSLKTTIIAPSFLDGMAWTRMALRS